MLRSLQVSEQEFEARLQYIDSVSRKDKMERA